MPFRTFAILATLLLATQTIFAANITAKDWGTTSKGEKVQLFTLKTGVRHGLVVEISNFGGVVVSLMVPDRKGVLRDVVLGYDNLSEYEKGGVYSALIGPYANRLSQSFKLNGQTITQPAMQFYTDNIANTVNGKKGHVYGNHNAISIETEHSPDAPSHPKFPSTEVTPDKPLHEITEYRFSSKKRGL